MKGHVKAAVIVAASGFASAAVAAATDNPLVGVVIAIAAAVLASEMLKAGGR